MRKLAAHGARVRICKGAYDELADIAFPRKADVDVAISKSDSIKKLGEHLRALLAPRTA